jgi:hypothetical protein
MPNSMWLFDDPGVRPIRGERCMFRPAELLNCLGLHAAPE